MKSHFRAAIFATFSVLCFALIGLFQQRLPQYSVITILGFRLLVGAGCIAAFVGLLERFSNLRGAGLWSHAVFRVWLGLFASTAVLYGFAFIGRSLADVCTIVGFMPIIVILIDVFYYKKPFRRALWYPVGMMFIATMCPSFYQLYKGHTASVFSWGTGFALLGAASHAAWVLMNRTMDAYFGKAGQAGRLFHMFVGVGAILLAFSNMDLAREIEERFRDSGFQQRFFFIGSRAEWVSLFFAGLCGAASVLAIARAVTFDDPAKVAPYQYTLAFWGALLALWPPLTPRPEFTTDVHIALGLASVVILGGVFWMYRLNR